MYAYKFSEHQLGGGEVNVGWIFCRQTACRTRLCNECCNNCRNTTVPTIIAVAVAVTAAATNHWCNFCKNNYCN